MTFEVRQASADELDAISSVLVAAFSRARPSPGVLDAAYDRYLAHIADVHGRFGLGELFVAVDDERVVGTGTLFHPDAELGYPGDRAHVPWPDSCAVMRLLAVDPTYWGRGVGRLLRDARIARARQLGATIVGFHSATASSASVVRWGFRLAPEYDYEPAPGICARAYLLSLAA